MSETTTDTAEEMKNMGRQQEATEQEGEEDTNVDDNQRKDDLNESIPVGGFIRPGEDTGPEGSVPDTDFDPTEMKEAVNHDKQEFIRDILGVSTKWSVGPNSTTLYDNLTVVRDRRTGRINGATYENYKVLVTKDNRIEYTTDKRLQGKVGDFKIQLRKAHNESKKTSDAQVGEHLKAQGLGTSEEHTESVLEETSEAVNDRISELRDKTLNNPDITANERREMEKLFSFGEYREMGGVAHEGLPKLTGDKKIDKDLIDGKLEAYEKDAKHWKELAEKEEEGSSRRLALELAERASKLKGDILRLLTGQRVQSKEALEIMEKVIENNDLTKLQKFRQWAKENLLELSAVAISVAGILTTVIMAGRNTLKRGAQAVSKFGKAVANLAKKFGPILSAIGTLISKVLTLGAQGILFLAQNLWILVLALTYFIYNEYMSRRGSGRTK